MLFIIKQCIILFYLVNNTILPLYSLVLSNVLIDRVILYYLINGTILTWLKMVKRRAACVLAYEIIKTSRNNGIRVVTYVERMINRCYI